jgi:hypothetical protein
VALAISPGTVPNVSVDVFPQPGLGAGVPIVVGPPSPPELLLVEPLLPEELPLEPPELDAPELDVPEPPELKAPPLLELNAPPLLELNAPPLLGLGAPPLLPEGPELDAPTLPELDVPPLPEAPELDAPLLSQLPLSTLLCELGLQASAVTTRYTGNRAAISQRDQRAKHRSLLIMSEILRAAWPGFSRNAWIPPMSSPLREHEQSASSMPHGRTRVYLG